MTTITDHLKKVLADTYALYLKTQNYHWNVTSPHFKSLHLLFEEQYSDLAEAIDATAELIRMNGDIAPGTWKAYQALTSLTDGDERAEATKMVADLASDQDKIQKTLSTALKVAQDNNDEVVVNFLTERLTVHRKNAWMLKSTR